MSLTNAGQPSPVGDRLFLEPFATYSINSGDLMRPRGTILLTLALLGATLPRTAGAGANANALICLHAQSVVSKNACTRPLPLYYTVVDHAALLPSAYFVYLVVVDGNGTAGIGGLQCGVQYDGAPNSGVDVYAWQLCATLEFTSTGWPASGGGNLITWDTAGRCQRTEPGGAGTGVTALAGYFYCAAYSPDLFRVIPRPIDGKAKVADCSSNEDLIGGTGYPGSPPHLGVLKFSASGTEQGYCYVDLPVQTTTWSGIKALHGR